MAIMVSNYQQQIIINLSQCIFFSFVSIVIGNFENATYYWSVNDFVSKEKLSIQATQSKANMVLYNYVKRSNQESLGNVLEISKCLHTPHNRGVYRLNEINVEEKYFNISYSDNL